MSGEVCCDAVGGNARGLLPGEVVLIVLFLGLLSSYVHACSEEQLHLSGRNAELDNGSNAHAMLHLLLFPCCFSVPISCLSALVFVVVV